MRRACVQLARVGELDHRSAVHHRHFLRHLRYHAQIVGNQHYSSAVLFAQVSQALEHLRLQGDVEVGGGFVRDEDFRLQRHSNRHHHALRHAAA